MILTELGQILPDPLKYLELSFKIDPNDLKILLGHCKLIELKTLLIRNFNHKNVDVTFNILKEFVRERKVRNFAYQVYSSFNPDNPEHRNLKTLVNGFQPLAKIKDVVIRF